MVCDVGFSLLAFTLVLQTAIHIIIVQYRLQCGAYVTGSVKKKHFDRAFSEPLYKELVHY